MIQQATPILPLRRVGVFCRLQGPALCNSPVTARSTSRPPPSRCATVLTVPNKKGVNNKTDWRRTMMKVPPVILVLDEDGSMWAVSPHGEGWVGDEHAPDPREVAEFLSILYNTGFEADFESAHNDWVTAYGVLPR